MRVIEAVNGADAIYKAAEACRDHGLQRSPRGQLTHDLGPTAVVVERPWDPVPLGINRPSLSPAIGIAEGLQLVAGTSNPALMTQLSPFFGELLDPRGQLDGAYGPRVRDKIPRVIEQLRVDPDTRQAVALVWNERDPLPGSKDIPCTVSLTFYIRERSLCLHAAMRSSDVYLGLTYDIMQFALLQCSVRNALCDVETNLSVGPLTVSATSMHLYARNYEAAEGLTPWAWNRNYGQKLEVGTPLEDWETIQARALAILYGEELKDETVNERYLRETLHARVEAVRPPVLT